MSLEKNKSWLTNDLTTLIMKLGYDRIYRTLLPININNKLVGMNETVKIKDKILKNCIKIEGIGETSYNPGPPLPQHLSFIATLARTQIASKI